ncbi:MAG TPA: tRNA (adenosine(37)-N6)-threonylcarbamoyltransferase complex dimerization subunit type 1 TsaB [Casimicrobiaceae bacterium]|nr:tRNA (adenosine(37)-N6)-threonylcarbamoyltransferase complex dimerization subunit type 1 TsaB [Casimicrobiaceae bacterium]
MRILALDTSTDWCAVAAGDGARWHVREERAGRGHSERLVPMIDAALAEAGWSLSDLDGLAFGAGPGSFTGIRIGCGVAQGLAFGCAIRVIAVPTLAAIAQEAFRARGWQRVITCLDARMREVYAGSYARAGTEWREIAAPTVGPPQHLVPPATDGSWAGAGNGFSAYPALATRLALTEVDASVRPTARAIGELALPRFVAGEGVPAAAALPLYVRHRVALTTAERDAGLRL